MPLPITPVIDKVKGNPNSKVNGNSEIKVNGNSKFTVLDQKTDDNNASITKSNENQQSLLQKHKRAISPFLGHSPPKIARLQETEVNPVQLQIGLDNASKDLFTTTMTSNNMCNNSGLCSIETKLNCTYLNSNHTVTSADFQDQNQYTSVNTVLPMSHSEIVPDQNQSQPLYFKTQTLLVNSATSADFLYSRSVESNHAVQHSFDRNQSSPPSLDLLGSSNLNETEAFYQLLDMFPGIDKHFLRAHCRRGLDTTQIADIVLELNNNYPKEVQSSHSLPRNVCFGRNNTINMFSNRPVQNVLPPNPSLDLEGKAPFNQVISKSAELLERNSGSTSSSSGTSNVSYLFQQDVEERSLSPPDSALTDFMNFLEDQPNETVERNKDDINCPLLNESHKKDQHVNRQFDFLLTIFPDADPAFLETKSKLGGNDLQVFIGDALEKRDYPKLKVKKEKPTEDKEHDDLGLYTTAFNVEHFLKIFKDPFEYFLDEKRVCNHSSHGYEFLKRRFRNHSVKTITQKYKDCKFNLVKTCEYLDQQNPSRLTKRPFQEIQMPTMENLPFLQEACFIEHKTEIKAFIDSKAEAKKLAFQQAEEKGELIDCQICCNEVLFEDCAACNEGDLFCKQCIQKMTEIRIGEGLTTFPCLLAPDSCNSEFSVQLLQTLIEARVFSKLLQRIQLDEVKAANIEDLEICPFCEFATIPPPDTSIFTCLNPECLKESCRKCHKISHIPQRCEEVENDDQARARKYIEDEMTRALVRECYKCKKNFIKLEGCNKMTCTCGAMMCYICRQPVTNYSHFNGPGGSDGKKCPLFSTNKVLHEDAVNAVAERAKKLLKTANPELQLKHDPTPVLLSSSSGNNQLPPGVKEVRDELLANLLRRTGNDGLRVANNCRHHRHPSQDQLLNAIERNMARHYPENYRKAHVQPTNVPNNCPPDAHNQFTNHVDNKALRATQNLHRNYGFGFGNQAVAYTNSPPTSHAARLTNNPPASHAAGFTNNPPTSHAAGFTMNPPTSHAAGFTNNPPAAVRNYVNVIDFVATGRGGCGFDNRATIHKHHASTRPANVCNITDHIVTQAATRNNTASTTTGAHNTATATNDVPANITSNTSTAATATKNTAVAKYTATVQPTTAIIPGKANNPTVTTTLTSSCDVPSPLEVAPQDPPVATGNTFSTHPFNTEEWILDYDLYEFSD